MTARRERRARHRTHHDHPRHPDTPVLPSGGFGMPDTPAWVRAGTVAVSMGSSLLGNALRGGSLVQRRPSHCAGSASPSPGSAAWTTTPSVTSSSGNCAPKASPSSPPAAAPIPPASWPRNDGRWAAVGCATTAPPAPPRASRLGWRWCSALRARAPFSPSLMTGAARAGGRRARVKIAGRNVPPVVFGRVNQGNCKHRTVSGSARRRGRAGPPGRLDPSETNTRAERDVVEKCC